MRVASALGRARSTATRVAGRSTRGRRARARVASAGWESSSGNAPHVVFVGWEAIDASASAAGARSEALVRGALDRGWRVSALSSADRGGVGVGALGARVGRVEANRGGSWEAALEGVEAPDVVVFDRFLSEEAHSWRVRELWPNAARILDMQDCHALRRARERAATAGAGMDAVVRAAPGARDRDQMREIASAQRSDLTLVCSPVEARWLRECGVVGRKLRVASFFEDDVDASAFRDDEDFDGRRGFVTIGTFMHKPNVDSVAWLREEVWPLVRERLPDATMRVYGSYMTEAHRARFHDPRRGFEVVGFAPDLNEVMRSARVLLAPLRFGAGIKGKVLDAWKRGTPVVTTPIGAEGTVRGVDEFWRPSSAPIDPDHGWGGFGDRVSANDIAEAAVRLHEDRELWSRARRAGANIINEDFSSRVNIPGVLDAIEDVMRNIDSVRDEDYIGQALWHHTEKSTTYFSKWIELKETGGNA